MRLFMLLLLMLPALPTFCLTDTAQDKGDTKTASAGAAVSATAHTDWKAGIEDLVPGSNPWKEKGITADTFKGHALLSTALEFDSAGGSRLYGMAGYQVSPNLNMFTMTRGGVMNYLDESGNRQSASLPALSTLGVEYGGFKLYGWDMGLSASMTPALRSQGSAGPNSEATRLGWGSQDSFGLGTTISRNWGCGMKTMVSVQYNQPSSLSSNDGFGAFNWMDK